MCEVGLRPIEGERAFEPVARAGSAAQDRTGDFGGRSVGQSDAEASAVTEREPRLGDEADAARVGVACVDFDGGGVVGLAEEAEQRYNLVGESGGVSAIVMVIRVGAIERREDEFDFVCPGGFVDVGFVERDLHGHGRLR